ncbi:MAG: hypothetical protein NZ730_06010 [Porticoccaceae bacterium]|nr:hypothetical protein [Porticoccaceae bacterium]
MQTINFDEADSLQSLGLVRYKNAPIKIEKALLVMQLMERRLANSAEGTDG